MTAPDPAWVEVGARASAQWHRNEDAWDSDDRALAYLILTAVEPLIREQIAAEIEAVTVGWVQYQRMPENTTHIAYVHENGDVYDPERGWLPKGSELLLDHDCPLIPRDIAAAIARGGAR